MALKGLGRTRPDKQQVWGLLGRDLGREVETQTYKPSNSLQSVIVKAFKRKPTLPGAMLLLRTAETEAAAVVCSENGGTLSPGTVFLF